MLEHFCECYSDLSGPIPCTPSSPPRRNYEIAPRTPSASRGHGPTTEPCSISGHKFRDLRAEQKAGRLNCLPKRDAAILKRQLSHLQAYLGGIQYMTGLPDIVIIVDQQEEYTALFAQLTRLKESTLDLLDL